ncbi:MAG: hypothetical protein U9N18_03345 [Campylobacterota bacterium]|nr:hypothetical protein [Campylobacterota bacterium]
MKKLISFIIILGIVAGVWWKHTSYVKSVKNSVQGEPARTVKAFMGTVVKMSNLIWKEEERNIVLKDLKAWSRATEEGKKKEIPESFKKYGIDNPARFFKKEKYGKSALSVLVLYEYKSYSVDELKVDGNKAEVGMTFLSSDFMGLGKAVSNLAGKQVMQHRKKPLTIPFYLEQHRYKWYIVDIGGKEGDLIRASHRMNKYK